MSGPVCFFPLPLPYLPSHFRPVWSTQGPSAWLLLSSSRLLPLDVSFNFLTSLCLGGYQQSLSDVKKIFVTSYQSLPVKLHHVS